MQCTLQLLQGLIRDHLRRISRSPTREDVRFRPYWVDDELVFGTDIFLQVGSIIREAPETLCAEFLSTLEDAAKNSCFSLNGFLNIKEGELARSPGFEEYTPVINHRESLTLEIAHFQLLGRPWELVRLASVALTHAWFRQRCGLSTLVVCDSSTWEFVPERLPNFSHTLNELMQIMDNPSQDFRSIRDYADGYLALGLRGYEGADRVPRPRVMFTTSQLTVPSFTLEPVAVLSVAHPQPIDLMYYLGRSTLDETFDPHVPSLAERSNRGWWSRFLHQKLQEGAEYSSIHQTPSSSGKLVCYYKAALLWEVASKDIKNAYVAFDRLWDGVAAALYPSHRDYELTAGERGLLAEQLTPWVLGYQGSVEV